MVMFAGHDDTNVGHRNDIWEYDYANRQWRGVVAGDDGVGAGCTRFANAHPTLCKWTSTVPSGSSIIPFRPSMMKGVLSSSVAG